MQKAQPETPPREDTRIPLSLFEALLQEARPRLVRFAYQQGIAPDAVEDIVQETLLTAHRIVERLWSLEHLYPWLEGICRHVSQHHQRTSRQRGRREIPLSLLAQEDELFLSQDTLAELIDRQALGFLLDRALGHLSRQVREVIELCYLAELPPQEVAARLHLSANALDVRLHRARRQLRCVLAGSLRAEAEACGLHLSEDESIGWRDTGIWCWGCARQRLRGILEPLPDQKLNLRLRCPSCSSRFGKDLFWTKGLLTLKGLRSLRPAIKRAQEANYQFFAGLLIPGEHRCPQCQRPVIGRVASSEELGSAFPGQHWVAMHCPTCGNKTASVIFTVCKTDPAMREVFTRFTSDHPRWTGEPTVPVTCMGQPALRVRLFDIASTARLTVLVHDQTLDVLSYFLESSW